MTQLARVPSSSSVLDSISNVRRIIERELHRTKSPAEKKELEKSLTTLDGFVKALATVNKGLEKKRRIVRGDWVDTTAGVTPADLIEWNRRLEDGLDVQICVDGGGGRFMVVTDVRGAGQATQYQVADPSTGITTWVSAADIQNPTSGWPHREFANGKSYVSTYYAE